MLPRIIKATLNNKLRLTRFQFSSSPSVTDPYYILGIEKTADFAVVKQAYFKLAREYHPDRDPSKDAVDRFLLVKSAFEAIKVEKGLLKPMSHAQSYYQTSTRPNPTQFQTSQEEHRRNNSDYTIFKQKAEASQKFGLFTSSFDKINDINDLKIRVETGTLLDPLKRFKLENLRVQIQFLRERGFSPYIIITIVVFLILGFGGSTMDEMNKEVQFDRIQEKRATLETTAVLTSLTPSELETKFYKQSPHAKSIQKQLGKLPFSSILTSAPTQSVVSSTSNKYI